jgi:hypothetical protein
MPHVNMPLENIRLATEKLLHYCRVHDWAGFDPYDGLNSLIFQSLKFLHRKYPRLVLTQFMKKSPVNLRRLFRVPESQNPKGIALFLTSCIKLARVGLLQDDELIKVLAERLIELSSTHEGVRGWGYNFDWQSLTGFAPRGTPNIICTTFAGHALIDAFDFHADPRFLKMASEAVRFIQNRLFYELNDSEAFFSYMPVEMDSRPVIPIHNANLLGASLLSRVACKMGNKSMLDQALKAMRFSLEKQHEDGAWDYGEWDHPSQRWIDNFHTGFNLCAIRRICRDTGTAEFESHIRRGFKFYRRHFFSGDGAPKYFHDSLYPIDIHSAAQSIITLAMLKDLDEKNIDLAKDVLAWTMSNMYDEQGYYYFQKQPWGVNKIPYMRWSQAWMLLALSTLLETLKGVDV